MNIIEKLGITPGRWDTVRKRDRPQETKYALIGGITIDSTYWSSPAIDCSIEDARLIATAPEMLEALIECAEALDYIGQYDTPIGLPEKVIGAIEKATGKTWGEIKALGEDKA